VTSLPATGEPFASLVALRAAHTELLKRHRAEGETPTLVSAVEQFLACGRATGALLSEEDGRWMAQSLLDYWSTTLYRAGAPTTSAALVEFDPELAPVLPDDACPYLGLDAFHEADAELFFGRGRVVLTLIERLHERRLLTIVGPSGSGKSSLIRAGLIPALRAGTSFGAEYWHILPPMLPGSNPLDAFEQVFHTLPGAASNATPLLLVIDQFEEAFTLCTDNGQRAAFLDHIVGLVTDPAVPHRVALTMRSDFEPFVTRNEALWPLFEAGKVTLPPLSASELREAIERPAERVGLKFEAGVVERLLQDILGEPAGLPLLQFTLLKLWDQRERNRVTLAAYERVGGGRRALARSADTLYARLIPQEQITAKRILLRMVRPAAGLEVTSNRVRRADLDRGGEDPGRVARVLDKLVAARLVRLTLGEAAGDTQVEVAHEALVRNWPTLVEWLEVGRLNLRQRQRLTAAAEQWQLLERAPTELLRGELLTVAQSYDDLSDLEADFVQASRDTEEAEREREAAERKREREAAEREHLLNRRLRWSTLVATVAAMIAIIAAVAAGLAYVQSDRRLQLLDNYRLAREAQIEADPELGLLLAYEAGARSDALIPALALRDTLGHMIQQLPVPNDQAGPVFSASFSPDGTRIVTASDDGTAQIWNAETAKTGATLITFEGHTGPILGAAFSPDGMRIVTGSDDGTARVWNAETGEPLVILEGYTKSVFSVAFSPDGTRIITASGDSTARVWNAKTGALRLTLTGHTDRIRSAAFSPDGTRIVTASNDGTARLWDAETGERSITLMDHNSAVSSASFSPDGTRIVTGSDDGTARVWDAATGGPLFTLKGHTGSVFSVAFSPDGTRIVTGSSDGTARIWDAATGGSQLILEGHHSDAVNSAAFSPDGTRIVTASSDGTARVWIVVTQQLLTTLTGYNDVVKSAAFSPDGTRIVTASDDGTARVWDAAKGRLQLILEGHTDVVKSAAFSPDGTRIVTASSDGTALVWNADNGEPPLILKGRAGAVNSAAFSPDGTQIVTGSDDGTARVWDANTGELRTILEGHTAQVNSVAFSPDGKRIVTASSDSTARVWDANTGELQTILEGHTAQVNSAAFSRDGTRIVTASSDRTARVWDANTGVLQTILPVHTGPIFSAAFSPDGEGTRIVTTSDDASARVYLVHTRELLKVAACLLTRELTDPEVTQFQIVPPLKFDYDSRQCPPSFSWQQK